MAGSDYWCTICDRGAEGCMHPLTVPARATANTVPLVPVFDSEPVSSVSGTKTRSSVPNPAERQQ